MKTKTISIRIDAATEIAIENIMTNIETRYGNFGMTKSHVVCAAIKEFAKAGIDIQKDSIVNEKVSDGRRRTFRRYLY